MKCLYSFEQIESWPGREYIGGEIIEWHEQILYVKSNENEMKIVFRIPKDLHKQDFPNLSFALIFYEVALFHFSLAKYSKDTSLGGHKVELFQDKDGVDFSENSGPSAGEDFNDYSTNGASSDSGLGKQYGRQTKGIFDDV